MPDADGGFPFEEFEAEVHGQADEDEGATRAANDDEPLTAIDWKACARRDVPPRRWLVEGWIPHGSVTALYGDGGVGKSLLAQQLLTAAATGYPWLGLPVTKGPALGVFCEDDRDELWRRQHDINAHMDIGYDDVRDLFLIPRVGDDNLLMTFGRDGRGTVTKLYQQLLQFAVARRVRTIGIDTAADTFGGNENDRGQARQFIQALIRVARAIHGQVLLLAHPSRAGLNSGSGDGGSTAWHNTVRSRLYLTRPDEAGTDRDTRVLRSKKANYGRDGDELTVRWRNGVFVRPGDDGGMVGAIDRRGRETAVDEAFLACLRALNASGRHASNATTSPDRYAPKLFRTLPEGKDHSFKDLKAAMERLFAARRIRVESVQTTNRHYIGAIVEVAQ